MTVHSILQSLPRYYFKGLNVKQLTHYMAVKQTSFLPSKWNLYPKIILFGLKMMVKSGPEKIILKFLHAADYFPLLHKSDQSHKSSNKNNYLPAWRDFKIIFRPKMVFWGTDSILRVNPMYESVE